MIEDNLIEITFTAEEKALLDVSLANIESVFAGKLRSISTDERKTYGRVGNITSQWIRKTYDYMKQFPETIPFFIEMEQMDKDLASFEILSPVSAKAEILSGNLSDTLLLINHDLYSACISYYRNIKLLAKQNVPGAKQIYEDLSFRFQLNRKQNSTPPAEPAQ